MVTVLWLATGLLDGYGAVAGNQTVGWLRYCGWQPDCWMVTVLWLGSYGSPFLQSCPCTEWFPSLRTSHDALHWQWFATDLDVKQAVTLLKTLDTDFFCAGIQVLVPWLNKCLSMKGDKVGVWWIPSTSHVPSTVICRHRHHHHHHHFHHSILFFQCETNGLHETLQFGLIWGQSLCLFPTFSSHSCF